MILFGRGCLEQLPELLGTGYVVLTTPRARDSVPGLLEGAADVHEVPAGRVDELAGELRPLVHANLLVALGGGRLIDVAKALAAADPPRRVAAIPTTLSGAEMTQIHRHATGVDATTPRVRPAIVANDPALSASQPRADLARSAANALGHVAEGPLTPLGNPVARLAALGSARLLAAVSEGEDQSARDALALGALLAGYVIGSTGYGLHHVLSQTLARYAGVGHGAANAVMLPYSLEALAARDRGDFFAALEASLGEPPVAFATRLRELGQVGRLRDAGVAESDLDLCVQEAAQRPELYMTPPVPTADELRAIYAAAY